jgi:transposase
MSKKAKTAATTSTADKFNWENFITVYQEKESVDEIASALGISKPTVYQKKNQLEEKGIYLPAKKRSSGLTSEIVADLQKKFKNLTVKPDDK